MSVLERFYQGDRRALSRVVSFVENREDGYHELLGKLYSRNSPSLRVGITGPPGAGKSTIVDALCRMYLRESKTVGIIAVDPSSPFTGGALLGDRVRLQEMPSDGNLFFRSMATRGATGGLAGATDNVAICYDAFGFDLTLIETVGVGQVELDIVDNCDIVVVVLVPESGDSIQTMKAGLLEVADIFCVNKADRPGSDRIITDLRHSLDIRKRDESEWNPPVLATEAVNLTGIDRLESAIGEYEKTQRESGEFERRRRQRIRKKIINILRYRFQKDVLRRFDASESLDSSIDSILSGASDPFTVANDLYNRFTSG